MPRLSFFFANAMPYLVEVAKLRAARVLWGAVIAKGIRVSGRKIADAPHPLSDFGLVAGGGGCLSQCHPHHH